MSNWNFHYDEEEYARTIDGYLRARITTRSCKGYNRNEYKSTFFVVDYLPQKVKLSYAYVDSSSTRSTTESNKVRLYFSNTEGLNRIIIDCLRQGSRVPSRMEIMDIKKGYVDVEVDRTTTFTAVGYNDNGISKGVSITVAPAPQESSIDIQIANNCIYVESSVLCPITYTITSIGTINTQPTQRGTTTGVIDITSIPEGLYVLKVEEISSNLSKSLKFKKK